MSMSTINIPAIDITQSVVDCREFEKSTPGARLVLISRNNSCEVQILNCYKRSHSQEVILKYRDPFSGGIKCKTFFYPLEGPVRLDPFLGIKKERRE
ncbi:MAG: hypothetical protein ABIB79_04650 [archaeon]